MALKTRRDLPRWDRPTPHSTSARPAGGTTRPAAALDHRPLHARRAAWVERGDTNAPAAHAKPISTADRPFTQIGAPFRGGQPPTAPTAAGDTPANGTTPTATIEVTNQNFELLRRFDANRDGVLERSEMLRAAGRGGTTRIQNESRDLTSVERRQLAAVAGGQGTIGIGYRSATGVTRVGTADRQMSWQQVRTQLFDDAAQTPAPLGRVGQGRPGSTRNNDCGPTCALFMNDRREAAVGRSPTRTHTESDALIAALSRGSGTTAPEMAGLMNDSFRNGGGRYYTHAAHTVASSSLPAELATGLTADPGGVMVPVISTFNEADRTGTRHWLVVTDVVGDQVSYYDPAGPDGARHLRTMPMSELQDMLPATNTIFPNQIVYGTGVPESSVAGALPTGRRIGELEVTMMNRELNVRSQQGVYGNRADAQAAARTAAAATGEDAIVRRENGAYAVYGITEIRDQFGGYGSDNTLAELDDAITDVYMTDQSGTGVRRATSGP